MQDIFFCYWKHSKIPKVPSSGHWRVNQSPPGVRGQVWPRRDRHRHDPRQAQRGGLCPPPQRLTLQVDLPPRHQDAGLPALFHKVGSSDFFDRSWLILLSKAKGWVRSDLKGLKNQKLGSQNILGRTFK